MSNNVSNAVSRAERFLKHYDDGGRPAEVIADLIHYCREKNINFAHECEVGNAYAEGDVALDSNDEDLG